MLLDMFYIQSKNNDHFIYQIIFISNIFYFIFYLHILFFVLEYYLQKKNKFLVVISIK